MHNRVATLLFFLLLFLSLQPAVHADVIRIAVAANFKPTLQSINAKFEANSGHQIKVSSASSSTLANQLLRGAPFDIFFSADKAAPSLVIENLSSQNPSIGKNDFFCYARGQLALLGGNHTLEQLGDTTLSLAIANPVTAPYGKAAAEILAREEFASAAGRKIVRGNNAIQAYQFWHTGSTALVLAPLSLAKNAPKVTATKVPTQWYAPIEQYALVVNPSVAVSAYMNWFRSDTVQGLIQQAGYLPCH